jgi:hypothetical protein
VQKRPCGAKADSEVETSATATTNTGSCKILRPNTQMLSTLSFRASSEDRCCVWTSVQRKETQRQSSWVVKQAKSTPECRCNMRNAPLDRQLPAFVLWFAPHLLLRPRQVSSSAPSRSLHSKQEHGRCRWLISSLANRIDLRFSSLSSGISSWIFTSCL